MVLVRLVGVVCVVCGLVLVHPLGASSRTSRAAREQLRSGETRKGYTGFEPIGSQIAKVLKKCSLLTYYPSR